MPPAGARRAARLARRASGYQNIKLLSSPAVARRAFLLGGSGQTGRALIPRLQRRGWEVVVASRGEREVPVGVEHVTVDRGAEGALEAAVGDGADVLVDFAAFEPEHAEQLLALRDRVGSLVVLSSAAVYFPEDEADFARLPVPIAERTETVPPGPGGRVLNAGDPEPPTVVEIARAIAANLEHDWAEVLIDEPVGNVGETVWSTPHPVVLDMTEAEFELGYRPVTTYAQALPETVAWLVEATSDRDWREVLPTTAEIMERSFDYAAEDELISRLSS